METGLPVDIGPLYLIPLDDHLSHPPMLHLVEELGEDYLLLRIGRDLEQVPKKKGYYHHYQPQSDVLGKKIHLNFPPLYLFTTKD